MFASLQRPSRGPTALDAAEAYLARVGPRPETLAGRKALAAHAILMRSAFPCGDEGSPSPPVRRSSITADGTPFIYSVKAGPDGGAGFRTVVEPGGYAIRTDQQIVCALACLDDLHDGLNRHESGHRLRGAVVALLPRDLSATRNWWGGVWVGIDATAAELRVKAYVNMRPHAPDVAWTMLARLFAQLGADVEAIRRAAVDGGAAPMGACVATDDEGIAGVRLYLGVARPTPGTVRDLSATLIGAAGSLVYDFCAGFADRFGTLAANSAAVAVDFPPGPAGMIQASPTRIKAELCAELLPADCSPAVLRWLLAEAQSIGRGDDIRDALDLLNGHFGGLQALYVSLGVTAAGERHYTAYVKPTGARLPHGLAGDQDR